MLVVCHCELISLQATLSLFHIIRNKSLNIQYTYDSEPRNENNYFIEMVQIGDFESYKTGENDILQIGLL